MVLQNEIKSMEKAYIGNACCPIELCLIYKHNKIYSNQIRIKIRINVIYTCSDCLKYNENYYTGPPLSWVEKRTGIANHCEF